MAKMFILLILTLSSCAFAAADEVLKRIAKNEGAISTKLTPHYLKQDFNGDGRDDIAVIISGKLCIFDLQAKQCTFVAGDFSWVDQWKIYKKPAYTETLFNEAFDLIGEQSIKLENVSIELCQAEVACNLVSFKHDQFIVIHQGC